LIATSGAADLDGRFGPDLGMVSPSNFDQSESGLKDKIGHDTGDILDEKMRFMTSHLLVVIM